MATNQAHPARRWSLLPRRHAQNWEIYASLLFLAFYFAGMPSTVPTSVAAALATVLVFLALYFSAYWLSPLAAGAAITAIVALGGVQIADHSGASVFFGYAASLACYLFSPRFGIPAALVILAMFMLLAGSADYPESYLAVNGLVIVAVAAIYVQARRSTSITERLRLREAELATIHRASERRRIAHDLHDLLGQHLVLIALKADLASRRVNEDAAAAGADLADIGEAARDTLNTVRRVVAGYSGRPLAEEVRRAEEVLRASNIEPESDVRVPDALTERQECFLALILSEAVTNVARHAQARRCRIRLAEEDDRIVLEITDDGRGAARYAGFGTDGIRERAARLGGQAEFRKDGGTRVFVSVPRDEAP